MPIEDEDSSIAPEAADQDNVYDVALASTSVWGDINPSDCVTVTKCNNVLFDPKGNSWVVPRTINLLEPTPPHQRGNPFDPNKLLITSPSGEAEKRLVIVDFVKCEATYREGDGDVLVTKDITGYSLSYDAGPCATLPFPSNTPMNAEEARKLRAERIEAMAEADKALAIIKAEKAAAKVSRIINALETAIRKNPLHDYYAVLLEREEELDGPVWKAVEERLVELGYETEVVVHDGGERELRCSF